MFSKPKEAPIIRPEIKPQTEQVQNTVTGVDPSSSLIETGSQGLRRRASVRKSSLIGGYGEG